MSNLRILSFNVRMSWGEYGCAHNTWKDRKDLCLRVVREGGFDFIGLQETMWYPGTDPKGPPRGEIDQIEDFRTGLPEYGLVGTARDADPADGEGSPIFYRRDRWEPDAAEQGVFWLSETPDVRASRSWESRCTRICTWALFHELSNGVRTGRRLVFSCVHLDHGYEHAQLRQAAVVAGFLRRHVDAGRDVMLVGDFNAYPESWPYRYLCGETLRVGDSEIRPPLSLRDAWREANPDEPEGRTFHGWGDDTHDERIDYILYDGPSLRVKASTIDRRTYDGRFPSDHYPVSADFSFLP